MLENVNIIETIYDNDIIVDYNDYSSIKIKFNTSKLFKTDYKFKTKNLESIYWNSLLALDKYNYRKKLYEDGLQILHIIYSWQTVIKNVAYILLYLALISIITESVNTWAWLLFISIILLFTEKFILVDYFKFRSDKVFFTVLYQNGEFLTECSNAALNIMKDEHIPIDLNIKNFDKNTIEYKPNNIDLNL